MVPNSLIDKVEQGTIYNNGTPEPVDIVVWTAGIQPVEIAKPPIDTNKSGRVIVNQYHQVPTYKMFGDCAALPLRAKCSLAVQASNCRCTKTMES